MAAGLLFTKRGGVKLHAIRWMDLCPLESSIDSASTYAVDSDLSTGEPRSQALSSNFKKSEPGNKLGPSFEQQGSGL